MPKPELEFFKPDHIAWEPVAGSATGGAGGAGVSQKILSQSADGDVTRLLRFDAGVETSERGERAGCQLRAARPAWCTARTGCRRAA